jgi:hypothetical protein
MTRRHHENVLPDTHTYSTLFTGEDIIIIRFKRKRKEYRQLALLTFSISTLHNEKPATTYRQNILTQLDLPMLPRPFLTTSLHFCFGVSFSENGKAAAIVLLLSRE